MGRKRKTEVQPPEVTSVETKVTETIVAGEVKKVKEEVMEVKAGNLTVRSITWEEFDKFEPERSRKERKSVFKEIVERARKEPVRVDGLKKGQIMVLIKLAYDNDLDVKYDFKNGVILLAPPRSQIS
jgi:hypothetical protein